jgi:hypothetical protein
VIATAAWVLANGYAHAHMNPEEREKDDISAMDTAIIMSFDVLTVYIATVGSPF